MNACEPISTNVEGKSISLSDEQKENASGQISFLNSLLSALNFGGFELREQEQKALYLKSTNGSCEAAVKTSFQISLGVPCLA